MCGIMFEIMCEIVLGIMIAISGALSMLFLDKIMQWQTIFTILALLISFIAGFFIVYKFYKETPLKCFGVWALTCITGIVMYVIIVITVYLGVHDRRQMDFKSGDDARCELLCNLRELLAHPGIVQTARCRAFASLALLSPPPPTKKILNCT